MAKELQIPASTEPDVDVLLLVKVWLVNGGHGNWIMTLDNADDAKVFFGSQSNLQQYIPECSHGSLLVTSRDKGIGAKFTRYRDLDMINVGVMDPHESSRLICAKLGDLDLSEKNNDVNMLADRLGQLPLALAQASAFIQENGIYISQYLELLNGSDQSFLELLSEPFIGEGRDSSVPNAVVATWIVSFNQIRKQYPISHKILSTICWYGRQGITQVSQLFLPFRNCLQTVAVTTAVRNI